MQQELSEVIYEPLMNAYGCLNGVIALANIALAETMPISQINDDLRCIVRCAGDLAYRISDVAEGYKDEPDRFGGGLTEYVNRKRPEGMPAVHGEAIFHPDVGFSWSCDEWEVEFVIHGLGDVEIFWRRAEPVPDEVSSYSFGRDGSRAANVDDLAFPGKSVELCYWPRMKPV